MEQSGKDGHFRPHPLISGLNSLTQYSALYKSADEMLLP